MHLLHTARKRCFRRLTYKGFTKAFQETVIYTLANWIAKHLEVINKCAQLVRSDKEDLFQELDYKLQQLLTKPLSLLLFFCILCSYNKFYFSPKFLVAVSKTAKKTDRKFLIPKTCGFNVFKNCFPSSLFKCT